MAKIIHNNFIKTVNDIVTQAKNRGIIHLTFKDTDWQGRYMNINGQKMLNFGTCGYLGLETDKRLIQHSMDYGMKFGTQFSISRAYVSADENDQLESLLSKIFSNKPVIVFSSTTLTHMAVMPIVIDPDDAIILDQQSHVSMQSSAQLLYPKGVKIDVIRHNNLEMLERKIKELKDKVQKIWYVIDGVYSMYGDIAPIQEINFLLKKYPQLHLYIDDAHGMSWHGRNGSGCLFEKTMENGKTVLISTLAKGFGTMGGVAVFPDNYMWDKVKTHGGPLAYSHPLPPPMIGAAIASAKIHLSEEIYELQYRLKLRLDHCNRLLQKTDLPVLSSPLTPIYFIGTGQPAVGYTLNKKILDDGFYVNIGMFPAVSVKNTGLRFTITNHVELSDIDEFVGSLSFHYHRALEEEGKSLEDVNRAFKIISTFPKIQKENTGHNLQTFNSIEQINRMEWDEIFENKGNFDYQGMQVMERAFSDNELPENNWRFYYIIIRDPFGKIQLATFFTSCLMKDDMLSPVYTSEKIEEERCKDKYFLTSRVLMMGSMLTEGQHFYVNPENQFREELLKQMISVAERLLEQSQGNMLILRDFENSDFWMDETLNDAGFIKVKMPNSNTLHQIEPCTIDDYLATLSYRSRKHIRKDVLKNFDDFRVEVKNKLKPSEVHQFYDLYKEVASGNMAINIFPYPPKLIHEMNGAKNWEFLCIYSNVEGENKEIPVAIGAAYFSQEVYCPVLLGMSQDCNRKHKVYKHMLFHSVQRARYLGKSTIQFGMSADEDKKKFGAVQNELWAYMQIKDNFNLEIIDKTYA